MKKSNAVFNPSKRITDWTVTIFLLHKDSCFTKLVNGVSVKLNQESLQKKKLCFVECIHRRKCFEGIYSFNKYWRSCPALHVECDVPLSPGAPKWPQHEWGKVCAPFAHPARCSCFSVGNGSSFLSLLSSLEVPCRQTLPSPQCVLLALSRSNVCLNEGRSIPLKGSGATS